MTCDLSGNARRRSLLFSCLLLLSCSSCAVTGGGPALQPQVSSLVVANRMARAADMIAEEKASYGHGNYLLYYLDRGLVEFYAGRHRDSVRSFEKAKQRFDELYTESLTKEVLSWAVNDYMLPYRGTDQEYVLINIFQALNFIALDDVNEAIVEARDLSSKYQVVVDLARKMKRSRFEDNGFARMFMGLLYEAAGRRDDRSEALLWYKEALVLYRGYYGGAYVPGILKERIGALARELDDPDMVSLQEAVGPVPPGEDLRGKGQIIVVQLVGFSPLKVAEVAALPIDGIVAQLALPRYAKRYYDIRSAAITAEGGGRKTRVETEMGQDIEDLAIRDLDSRKALVMTKAVLRPAMKYLIERKQKENMAKKNGALAASVFGVLGSLYNIFSEQADLRSWQALPAQIRIARLVVEPGEVRLRIDDLDGQKMVIGTQELAAVTIQAGETRFIVVRSGR